MIDFTHNKRTKMSYSKAKPIHGVGINDVDYIVTPTIDGKRVICPYYNVWVLMLSRIFDATFHIKFTTYKDCTISDEWLSFSNFREWMITQDWEGKQLDKDILYPNNKHYSKEICVFIPSQLNSFLTDGIKSRGRYPLGVSYHKQSDKYQANCSIMGKRRHLGLYSSSKLAQQAYIVEKTKHFMVHISEQTDQRVIDGLYAHLKILQNSQI